MSLKAEAERTVAIPWYQFFDDVKRLAIDNAFLPAVAFSSSNTTTGLGVSRVYRYTGTTGVVISLESNLLSLGAPDALYVFSIVDEGGAAGTNPITVSGGAATISGQNNIFIDVDYGGLTFYSNGTAFFILL